MPKITVLSIYGHTTKKPLVEIRWQKPGKGTPDRTVQLSIEEARDLALNILQGAESAIQDGFIVEFFREIGIDDAAINSMLTHYRIMRADRQSDTTA
jgi:hypothetical protein